MVQGNVLEVKKETTGGTIPQKDKKTLLVPLSLDGICGAVPLSRLFGVYPVFVNMFDAVSASELLNIAKESGSIPVSAGLPIMDETFFGTSGISIDHSRGMPVRGGIRTAGPRTVVEARTLCGAVLRLFAGKLTSREETLLRAYRVFSQWNSGGKFQPPGLTRGFILAAGIEVYGRGLFGFLRKHADFLSAVPEDLSLDDLKEFSLPFSPDGSRDVVTGHLVRQWAVARGAAERAERACAGDREKGVPDCGTDILRIPPKKGGTPLSALLALRLARRNTERPGLVCLSEEGTKKKRYFVLVNGASGGDFKNAGLTAAQKYELTSVKEIEYRTSGKLPALASVLAEMEKALGNRLRHEAAAELGGIDKGL